MTIEIDWAQEWADQSAKRTVPGTQDYWDKRSNEFGKHSGHSKYKDIFLDYLNLEPGQTTFDMGCGTGSLCVPLAKMGHQVTAADFSKGMLAAAEQSAKDAGVAELISFKQLAWQDDWAQAGIKPKSADVVLASRSTIVDNLSDAFTKLTNVARNKVCITVATDDGPKNLRDIFEFIGRQPTKQPDFIYAINLLMQQGFDPELRYIDTYKADRFATRAEAFKYYGELINQINPSEEKLLKGYLDRHLIDKGSEAEYRFEMNKERLVRWAFITWKPDESIKPRW